MTQLARLTLLLVGLLLLPAVPVMLLGTAFEERLATWLTEQRSPGLVAAGVFALLAGDLLLPVPSSVVSTYGGVQLGWLGGTLA